jgi:hypothetical protein
LSDTTLAALERRFRATGAIDDEERWLVERLRLGQLEERGLVIAAGLGHEASRRLAPAIGLGPLELVDQGEGEVRGRAAVAVVNATLMRMAERWPLVELIPWRDAADRADDWLVCPCATCVAALSVADGVWASDCPPECCWMPVDYDLQTFALALNAVLDVAGGEPYTPTWFERVSDMTTDPVHALDHEDDAERLARTQRVVHAVSREVIPWTLGYSDPVRERVAARRAPTSSDFPGEELS